ncbi:MAG: hypothetical protein B6D34_07860 [Candidatus Brocadia sp. UTAMX1]|jgi:serine/threonine protein kinase|nr:MAG: hypothetical protein B6D34_07860 [Candidatus Brocadia sp. UTAMX1]
MESRVDLDTEFGNLAISEGFITPDQVYTCQRIIDTFEDEDPRKSLDVVMAERGHITSEQRGCLLKTLGITIVFCPHCKKEFKKTDADLQEVMYCKYCDRSFEYQNISAMETLQTSITSGKTLASFYQQTCDFYIGKLLGGKYEVVQKIAVGGWSTIYKAKRRMLNIDNIVAVKILHINLSDNHQDIKRFYNEAATICELHHPNAIHLYDFDRDVTGTIYMAMEFVHGRNLKEIIRDHGPFNVERMLHIIFQVCDVIAAAHKHPKKIIHRDITPQNIMLSRAGELDDFVKVLDFGIAKLWSHENVSLTGSIIGTPLYMAPEQWRGACDERTDIYSLGIIMYEMLTGETPFHGDQIVLMNKHLNEKPTPFRKLGKKVEIPKYIEYVIFKCLEKNKDKRPRSVDELRSLLQNEKGDTRSMFAKYSNRPVLVMILISLMIPLSLYKFYWPRWQTENTPSNNIPLYKAPFQKTDAFQKGDIATKQAISDDAIQIFSNKKIDADNGFYNIDTSKRSVLTPQYRTDNGSNHIPVKNNQYKNSLNKIVDEVQKYAIISDPKETAPDKKEIIKNEIQRWLQEYKKAWEKTDIEALKEIGHISSEKEEKKLQKYYSCVRDITVSIRNEVIDIDEDNNQAVISFDREDEWTDERGKRHRKVLPKITKILQKEYGTWKIANKTDKMSKLKLICKKYKDILNDITVRCGDLVKQINNHFKK